ncbi:MAG TPA: hypothetical protein VH561_13210 [Micromonosporaceae bacterium]|jgi:hypothetical protein
MAGRESSGDAPAARPELTVSVDVTPPEQLASGPPQRVSWRLGAGIVAVVLAFAIGVVFGSRSRPAAAPQTSAAIIVGQNIHSTGQQCSAQAGTRLWLGIEVVNTGPGTVVLQGLVVNLPIGGFDVAGTVWGTCGQLFPFADTMAPRPPELATNEKTWLSAVLYPSDPCPAPFPVRFLLSYVDSLGRVNTGLDVGGFNDLGQVPYTGCLAS